MNKELIPAYEAYQKAIDLDLYYAFEELVVRTSKDEKAWTVYRTEEAAQIWQENGDRKDCFEAHNLRYPGEILERFEEKFGTDSRTIRALALALGRTRSFQTEDMFVGKQRRNFIQKIQRKATEDIYLQGAMYLLETDTSHRRHLLKQMMDMEYERLEEAMFVLSLFEDPEEGYRIMRSQLIRLFGKRGTFSLVENWGMLEWLIRYYAPYVKAYRGKSDLILRTFMKFPYMNFKPGSQEFMNLIGAGYCEDEIVLLNSLCVWAVRIKDRMSPDRISAEKIAAECVRRLLERPEGLPEHLYNYVGWLFSRYNKFEIQYSGHPSLWYAVEGMIEPSSPQTILWLNKSIQKDFNCRVDVFDPKYEILAKNMERGVYWELFTKQMLSSKGIPSYDRWLKRYQELTGSDYCDEFQSWHISSQQIFALLVEKGNINLWEFFEQHKKDGEYTPTMKLLKEYAMEISSWKCFCFVKRLLSRYTFIQLRDFFGKNFFFHRIFMENSGYRPESYSICICRPFFNAESRRQLFEWIDTSVFQTEPDKYEGFLWSALKEPEIQRLYDRKLLAAILRKLLSAEGRKHYNADQLKKKFYDKEELEADRKAAEEKAEKDARLRQEKEYLKVQEKMQQIFNGSMDSLTKFTEEFWSIENKNMALDMAYEKILEKPLGFAETLSDSELSSFFELCSKFANLHSGQEVLNMVRKVIGGNGE